MGNFTDQKLKNKILKQLSYTNRDYDSIIRELIKVLQETDIGRDWNNISSSDPFFILLHLMAAHKDILNYQIDYSVLEGYMATARERSSVTRIANSYGFKVPSYKAGYARFKVGDTGGEGFTPVPFDTVFYDTTGDINIPWVYIGEEDITYNEGDEDTEGDYIDLYQGVPARIKSNISSVDQISNTKIATGQQIAIGTTGPLVGASRIFVDDDTTVFTEVDNVLFHNEEDNNVYNLAEDTMTTVYIQFHPLAITQQLEDSNLNLTFEYIITRGANVLTANDMQADIGGAEVKLIHKEGTFIRGKNPASVDEVRSLFKNYYTGTDNLVTIKDYKNYIQQNQKSLPEVAKVLVIDTDKNSGELTNIDIGIGSADQGLVEVKKGEVWIYILQDNNKEPEATDFTELNSDLQDKRITSIEVKIMNNDNSHGIEKEFIQVGIKGIQDDHTKEKIENVVTALIDNLPIGGYITSGDIYTEILQNKDLAQTSRNLEVTIVDGNNNVKQKQLKFNQYGKALIEVIGG